MMEKRKPLLPKLYRVTVEIDVRSPDAISAKLMALEKLKTLPNAKIDYKAGDYEAVTVELLDDPNFHYNSAIEDR
jgi:hypothetical protein